MQGTIRVSTRALVAKAAYLLEVQILMTVTVIGITEKEHGKSRKAHHPPQVVLVIILEPLMDPIKTAHVIRLETPIVPATRVHMAVIAATAVITTLTSQI
jgi:hypothetical protein